MKTFSTDPGEERKEVIPCPVCGADDYRGRYTVNGAAYVQCRKCGIVFQNPMPLQDELKKRYAGGYFEYERENEKQFFGLMLKALQDVDFSGIREDGTNGNRFLDVGCATGMLLEHMKSKGWEEYGIEVCTQAAAYGVDRRGVRILSATLEEAAFPDNYFTVVHFSHLIEHIPDPAGFMREVARITRPGGYCIATTPNIAGFQSVILNSHWRSAIPDHVVLFSKRTLKDLLSGAGFIIEKSRTWGGLAEGLVPAGIKRFVDKAAKMTGTGDVVVMRARKPPRD